MPATAQTPLILQGRKIKRHKRVFKRQNEVVAPVGRDGLAREFGAEDSLADLEGVCQRVGRLERTVHELASLEQL